MVTLWKWFNGKKTVMGGVILSILPILPQFGITLHADVVTGLTYVGQLLVGGGLTHKTIKMAKK